MNRIKNIITVLVSAVFFVSFGQQTPAGPQSGPIAIMGATAHIGNGQVIDNSIIVFEDERVRIRSLPIVKD